MDQPKHQQTGISQPERAPFHAGLAFFVLATTLLSGCISSNYSKGRTSIGGYHTVEIEGCEYIRSYYNESGSLTHKGNCKNAIHKCP